jgi:ssDNA-binding Zn-finger/Zn-ribbon topoisomerase 1
MSAYGFECDKCHHTVIDDTTVNGWTCPKCKVGQMHRNINVKGGQLDSFTSVGCYTLIYLDERAGEVYCAKCAAELRDAGELEGPLTYGTHDEGPAETCGACGEEMESSYGDNGEGAIDE